MNEVAAVAPISAEDAAWATINTPLSVDELKIFCQDIERLFRINPMLEFNAWEKMADNRYHMAVKNISQEPPFEVDVELNVEHQPDEIIVHYNGGLKKQTIFRIEPSEFGSKLTLIDEYGLSEAESNKNINEVDKSLVNWADYLQRYLISWKKWSRHGWWRWYMKRIWQPMKPTGRRITYMFLWITLVEIALIILGAGIYWSEYT
ncbi:MAG: hypothetical protein P8Y24_09465 [Gammaproteobacteria bacterium]